MVYIPFRKGTRLGNWMFQFAAARSIDDRVAFVGDVEFMRKAFSGYERLFPGLTFVDKAPTERVLVQTEDPSTRFSPLRHEGQTMIDGYFQSAKYFDEQLVRRLFSPDSSMVGYLRGKYGAWLDSPGVTGISVRRGCDYLRIPDRHPFVGLGYFKKAISLFPAGTKFIVCSDDIRWCRKHFRGERFLFVEGESVLAQLYVHVLCQNNILSNSSFSWWGGWLNAHPGKKVIAPAVWYGMSTDYDTSDLLWDGVVRIRNRLSFGLWVRAVFNTLCLRLHRMMPSAYERYRAVRDALRHRR